MPTGQYTWIGPDELVKGKAKWKFTADKTTVTIPYDGEYEKMLADRPLVSGQVDGFTSGGLRVVDVEINEGEGPAGKMIVTLETQLSGYDLNPDPLGDPVYEIEFGELLKKIESHPRCGSLTSAALTAGKSFEEWGKLATADYDSTAAVGSPAWSFENYISLKKAGTDEYAIGAPIVRRQTKYYYTPSGMGAYAYKRQNPPTVAGAPSGYAWLAGPDRLVKEGRVRTRSEEWIGYEENKLSNLIYD